MTLTPINYVVAGFFMALRLRSASSIDAFCTACSKRSKWNCSSSWQTSGCIDVHSNGGGAAVVLGAVAAHPVESVTASSPIIVIIRIFMPFSGSGGVKISD